MDSGRESAVRRDTADDGGDGMGRYRPVGNAGREPEDSGVSRRLGSGSGLGLSVDVDHSSSRETGSSGHYSRVGSSRVIARTERSSTVSVTDHSTFDNIN